MTYQLVSNVKVWTPSGEEVWSGYADLPKGIGRPNYFLGDSDARAVGAFTPSSGLLYRALMKMSDQNTFDLKKWRPDFDGVATSTIIHPLQNRGSYAEIVMIQYPFLNQEESGFERDARGVPKGRQRWEMAMPIGDYYLTKLDKQFDPFVDALFGMEGSRDALAGKYASVITQHDGEHVVTRFMRFGPPDEAFLNTIDCTINPSQYEQPDKIPRSYRHIIFRDGENLIRNTEAVKKRLVVEALPEDAARYASQMAEAGIPFSEE